MTRWFLRVQNSSFDEKKKLSGEATVTMVLSACVDLGDVQMGKFARS